MNIKSIGYYIIEDETGFQEIAFYNGDYFYLIATDEFKHLEEIFKVYTKNQFEITDLFKLQQLKEENTALRAANAELDKRNKKHEERLQGDLDFWIKKCNEDSRKNKELQEKYEKLRIQLLLYNLDLAV